MKSRSSFMTFGGAVVLAGGLILTANAHAYGSAQWRPAQGHAPAPAVTARAYHRPTGYGRQFRPWVAEPMQPVQTRASAYAMRPMTAGAPYAESRQQGPGAAHYYRSASTQAYPNRVTPWPYQRDWHYPVPRTMPPVWHGGWGQSHHPVARTWGDPAWRHQGWDQAPMFARQYGWQPMMQPWIARQPALSYMPHQTGDQPRVYRSQQYPPQMPVTDRRFRPSPNSGLAANVPAYGSWRPAPVHAPRERYNRQAAARQHAVYRPHRPVSVAPVWAPPAYGDMPVSQSGQWRPRAAPVAYHWQASPPDAAFRPPAYGRSQPLERRIAEQDPQGSRQDRGLPGWVTTYPDLDASVACTWCGG